MAFVVVLAPWTIRNWVVFDRPVARGDELRHGGGRGELRRDLPRRPARRLVPPCLRDHPGKNEAENHDGPLRDGLRYAREHAGRLPVVLAARLGRVWSLYDPFPTPEGRSVRASEARGPRLLPAAALLGVAGVVALRRRGTAGVVDPALAVRHRLADGPATYGNLRFREPADVAVVVLAGVGLDALWRRRGPPADTTRPAT